MFRIVSDVKRETKPVPDVSKVPIVPVASCAGPTPSFPVIKEPRTQSRTVYTRLLGFEP